MVLLQMEKRLAEEGGGADVILATSNSYKSTANSIKGFRPDGRLILMGVIGNRTS
jgi:D-arabinose 1-dehydrogenase-like Zn-dependent alcohol dehydrogenase